LHGRLDLPEHQPLFAAFNRVPVVSISDSQRRPVAHANFISTVHHGLPVNRLRPQPATPSYLAFLGRISPEKRADLAIHIARRCGLPLKIAAKVDRADEDYFREDIAPLLTTPGVEFIGEIDDAQKQNFLSGAIALLVPIDWPEPFGIVMIEAMACGCPVIAFNRGAVPEIVEDGVTGFIVEDEFGAAEAVGKVGQLSRRAIRRRFEQRFTSRRMAEEYVSLYRSLIEVESLRPRLRSV
jgi:glycosyltransferase involved in cell wall biosynthesis